MSGRVFLKEGYVPLSKGHQPTRVQGGYIPPTGTIASPPSGGSAVKPPPPVSKK
jgi:hypothetical protein